MNLARYRTMKAKGLVKLDNVGGTICITEKKFDPDIGTETEPVTNPVDVASLTRTRDALLAQLANLNELLKDLAELKAP